MKYPFLDVSATYGSIKSDIDAAYLQMMASGMYIGGEYLANFEREFADYCGAQYCVGVGNGLDALVLPLLARGIGSGDEVIVPANTFIATWLAVSQTGAKPVPVDACAETMNIDLEQIEAAITDRTRAIMPVHLYGAPVRVESLKALAEKYNLLLLEDSAQAHGATDAGIRTGQLGHVAGFSFYPGKNLGAFGDGGAVVTDDAELADAVRVRSNYGSRVKYEHENVGANSRLDPLQAAFLSVKLKHLDAWNKRRQEIANIYLERLANTAGIKLPSIAQGTESVWHLFVIRHSRRDELRESLAKEGVQAALHYPIANHLSGAFRDDYGHLSFPVTEEICSTCLSLPIGPHMATSHALEVADIVDRAVRAL